MDAGLLRHRIDIEEYTDSQDTSTGEITKEWTSVFSDVPASYEPLSVRELILSQSQRNTIVARFVIRWRAGLNDRQRIVHRGTIYNIEGLQPDKDSGLDYVTIPCSTGAREEGA
jgi:SPP1 family predicted phage head-tail adaptor